MRIRGHARTHNAYARAEAFMEFWLHIKEEKTENSGRIHNFSNIPKHTQKVQIEPLECIQSVLSQSHIQ